MKEEEPLSLAERYRQADYQWASLMKTIITFELEERQKKKQGVNSSTPTEENVDMQEALYEAEQDDYFMCELQMVEVVQENYLREQRSRLLSIEKRRKNILRRGTRRPLQ